MDELDALIEDKRTAISVVDREIGALEHNIAELRESRKIVAIELAAFEKAAELRPLGQIGPTGGRSADADSNDIKGRGRQRGSISFAWRKVLGWMYLNGGPLDYSAIHQAAQSANINTSFNSIRDRVRDYIKDGLLEGSTEDGFTVTNEAVIRFKLGEPSGPDTKLDLDANVEEEMPSDPSDEDLTLDGQRKAAVVEDGNDDQQ